MDQQDVAKQRLAGSLPSDWDVKGMTSGRWIQQIFGVLILSGRYVSNPNSNPWKGHAEYG